MNCLYRMLRDSLPCPKLVFVRVLIAFSFLDALAVVFSTCEEKVRCVSRVTPRIVGVLLRGIVVLLRCSWGCLLDSRLSGVIRVTDDFCGDAVILFWVSQFSSSFKYCCARDVASLVVFP